MQNIKILDNSFNCWIVYLMPFDDKDDDKKIQICQQESIANGIFGMGWHVENAIDNGTEFTEKTKNDYFKLYDQKCKDNDWSDSGKEEKPCEKYGSIKVGDYVVMRLRDGHFYVGKVATKAKYIYENKEPFCNYSWGCKVEKWIDIEQAKGTVPSELRGRFSQRLHSTIQRVDSDRLKFLIKRMYDLVNFGKSEIPRVAINEYNLASSLDYRELEDLVAYYIFKKHNNKYMLLPSSGKTNEPKYEFRFVNVDDKNAKLLTCQVKNKPTSDLCMKDYEIDKELYEVIYIFIGNWNEDKIKEKEQECKDLDIGNIKIIRPAELLDEVKNFLSDNRYCVYLNLEYCSLDKINEKLLFYGYNGVKRFSKNFEKTFKYDKGTMWIEFQEGVYYSAEFGALIYDGSNDAAIEVKNKVCRDLEIRE